MKKRSFGRSLSVGLFAALRKRPLMAVCLGLIFSILTREALGSVPVGGERIPGLTGEGKTVNTGVKITGTVREWQIKERSVQYILENCAFETNGQPCQLKRVRVTDARSGDSGKAVSGDEWETDRNGTATHYAQGAVLCVEGELSLIEGATNPGQFDARDYYRTQGISYAVFAKNIEVLRAGGGLAERAALARERTVARQVEWLGEERAGVLAAITLGERAILTDAARSDYRIAGIFHIICISGLHISMLGMLLFRFLFRLGILLAAKAGAKYERVISAGGIVRTARERPVTGRLLLAVKAGAIAVSFTAMTTYCLFVGSPPSAIRAIIMFGAMLSARISGRSYDAMNSLCLAAILILAARPAFLFHSGFQLSFAAVIGAGLLYPKAARALSAGQVGKREKPGKGFAGVVNAVFKKISEGLLLWLCVTAVSLPLVAYYYYELSLWGFLANLILVPLVGVVLVSGLLSALSALFGLLLFARILLVPARLLLDLFSLVTSLVRHLPAASWVCGKPDMSGVILYYVLFGLGLVFVGAGFCDKDGSKMSRRKRQSLPLRRGAVRARALCIAAAFLSIGMLCLFLRPCPDFSLTMLDVGQGDALVIQNKAYTFLVDGGSSSEREVGTQRIIPYLKSRGIRRVDGIFVTHGDEDHISGIEELLDDVAERRCGIRVDTVFLPRWMRDDETGRILARKTELAGAELKYLQKGDAITAGEVLMKVLAPTGDNLSGNEGSLVLAVGYHGFRALLAGDLEGAGEEAVLPIVPDVDLLKVAHHGSRNSTTAEWLARCQPEICLVSAPDGGRYGHPHQETLDRIADAGADCYITKDAGAVTVTVREGQIRVTCGADAL